MKKLLLLTPIILSLASCNSSQLQTNVKRAFLNKYCSNGEIVGIEKLKEYENISVWLIMGKGENTVITGEFTYNSQRNILQTAWVIYEVADL